MNSRLVWSLSILVAAIGLFAPMEACAQSMGFDLSFMGPPGSTNSNKVAKPLRTGQIASGSATGTYGNVSRPTLSQSVAQPTNRRVPLDTVQTGILAENSVDGSPIPSGTFDYGFPKNGPSIYRGAYAAGIRSSALGNSLPQVSTSSVDINICDEGSFGSGGQNGGGGGGGNGSDSQSPPALPPGWTGVMCHGIYAGAIPPGGTVEAFWRGEYGFAGDAAQQAALLEEGRWLLEHGQIGP